MPHPRHRSMPFDSCGVYYDILSAMDGYLKDHIPGRYPWSTLPDALADTRAFYRSIISDLSERYDVSEGTIRNYAPGVSCSVSEVRAAFRSAA